MKLWLTLEVKRWPCDPCKHSSLAFGNRADELNWRTAIIVSTKP